MKHIHIMKMVYLPYVKIEEKHYLHFQKKYDQLKQYFSDPLIRNNIPSYVVSHFEKIMDENAK